MTVIFAFPVVGMELFRINTVRPATLRYYSEKLRRLLEFAPLAAARLEQVEEELIQEYLIKRKREVSIASVNRELAVLRRLLRVAQEWKLIQRVPRIRMLPGEKPREFVLNPQQERLYLEMTRQPLKDVAVLCLDTGMRIGEALRLTWGDVNMLEGYLEVRFGKSKNATRRLYMSPRVTEMLKGRQGMHPVFVFPGRPLKRLNGEIRPFTVEAVDKHHSELRSVLKLPREFVIHSLRHSFGTRLGASGVDGFAIKKIMGHSTVRVSERYIHPSDDAVRLAFEKLQKQHQPATVSATLVERLSVSN